MNIDEWKTTERPEDDTIPVGQCQRCGGLFDPDKLDSVGWCAGCIEQSAEDFFG
jgi:hypothetical protein